MEQNFWDYGKLRVQENGRYLANGDRPFFWMGDTAWLLFQKCTPEEAYLYLRNRKEKKYSVIQATLVHTLSGNNVIFTPQNTPDYWERCVQIVDMAADLGLYMALLPCWGSFVKDGLLTAKNAPRYARLLHKYFAGRQNIIWLLGGDVRGDEGFDVFELFGSCLRRYFPDCLIGFHPFGRTDSSYWFSHSEWLDFYMFQSGHRRYDQVALGQWDDAQGREPYFGEDNWGYVRHDHDPAIVPVKPTVDGEPSYEWIPQGLHDTNEPYWQARDVRRYAYWSVFEGAMGHTYGDNSIMQFFNRTQTHGAYGPKAYWQDALHHEGAGQMMHLVNLMTGVDFTAGRPNEARLTWGQKERYHRISVFEGPGYLFCYDYLGDSFSLDLESFAGQTLQGWWMDPATGISSYLGPITPSKETVFSPLPKSCDGSDWTLILKY